MICFPFHSVQVNTWDELLCRVRDIENWLSAQPGHLTGSKILFRGQADSTWRLETTLERRGRIAQIRCADYLKLAESIRNQIEDTDLEALSDQESANVEERLREPRCIFWALGEFLPILKYWIYLRHHGFPSPLLDWTRSLETAAYFAFKSAGTANIAIYTFCERPGGEKGGWVENPMIKGIAHPVCALERHKNQRAEYTLCLVPYSSDRIWTFTQHQEVLTLSPSSQDCLVKFEMPSALRRDVLRHLSNKGVDDNTLLPPVALDEKISNLVDEVFGTKGRFYVMRIR